ncbi:RNA polymerase sigma factor, sigma-70 family [Pelagirhabdus alkalitolerans]|uniref:RNA polymerase sigma factor, sigma-70 family n=1 Tax=Pelagirhabdus alkalitolerans TaxID=1612202 RepID=A0A1G6MZM0_9BACI|nr:sigma factor-like helix-turn-helix DNA-binding protein [Pelagirhabdus alkalitolerans]SDC60647.1 RNA polymerase sigma factor, sigma-70 family [Pelagirhabdus alkalitolerans]
MLDLIYLTKSEKQSLEKFSEENPKFYRSKLVRSFLKQYEHQAMFIDALCYPSEENRQKLDEAFRDFYTGVKIVSYLSKTIYWESVNFDKKQRYRNKISPLVLNDSSNLNEVNVLEKIKSTDKSIEEKIIEEKTLAIEEKIEDPKLKIAFLSLTMRQKEVLQSIYGNGENITDTAYQLDISQQAVSKIHKSALKRLKNIYLD